MIINKSTLNTTNLQVDIIKTSSLPHIQIPSEKDISGIVENVNLTWDSWDYLSFKIRAESNSSNIVFYGRTETNALLGLGELNSLTINMEQPGETIVVSEVSNSLTSNYPVQIQKNNGTLYLKGGYNGSVNNSGTVILRRTGGSDDYFDTIRYGEIVNPVHYTLSYRGAIIKDALHYIDDIGGLGGYSGDWNDTNVYRLGESQSASITNLKYCSNIIVEFDKTFE